MSKRLEITLFGSMHVVGAIHLPRVAIKTGMGAYGQKKWHSIVSEIALGRADKKLVHEVGSVVGHALKPSYLTHGISMEGRGFGFEVFYGGEFSPIEAVDAENKTLHPAQLMKGFKPGDMLGVFWARCESAMLFRWDDVEELQEEDVSLVYDSLGPLLGKAVPFDIILDVTWQGQKGRRNAAIDKLELHSLQHVLHKVN